MKFTINIYKENGEVEKTYEQERSRLLTGTVRKLSELLDLGNETETDKISQTMRESWETLTNLLNALFPEITDEEWERTDWTEVVEIIKQICLIAKEQAMSIPRSKKKR